MGRIAKKGGEADALPAKPKASNPSCPPKSGPHGNGLRVLRTFGHVGGGGDRFGRA